MNRENISICCKEKFFLQKIREIKFLSQNYVRNVLCIIKK